MRTMKRLAACVVLAVACGFGAGCVAAAAGAAAGVGIAYVNGNAEAVVEARPERVVEAAQAVFREMQIEPEGEVAYSEQNHEWQLKGDTPANGPAKVTVRRLAPDVAKVWVRVGRFGDQQLSVTVLQRIRERL